MTREHLNGQISIVKSDSFGVWTHVLAHCDLLHGMQYLLKYSGLLGPAINEAGSHGFPNILL